MDACYGTRKMTPKPRIIFCGTADFAVPMLDALMASELRPVSIYTRADQPAGRGRRERRSPVKERALQYGLDVREPRTLRDDESVERLTALAPSVIVTAAYGLIFPRNVLAAPPRGVMNVHPSLLPRHRGPAPVVSTVLEGDENAGVSIFLLDEGIDTGPILSQRVVPIRAGETAGELTDRLAQIGAGLLIETLSGWLEGTLTPSPQDHGLATHSRLLVKGDGEVGFDRSAIELERHILAMTPWPGAYTWLAGKRLGILRAVALPEEYDARGTPPGRIVRLRRSEDGGGAGVAVGTGEGLLELLEVQAEGRRAMTSRDFVRGHPEFIGVTLPG